MTFNFDGADILVILLVLVIHIIFRRFDKTGRSIENVRNYADRSKKELESIVSEKKVVLNDLIVDIGIQEKTNREILLRAETAKQEIVERTSGLEENLQMIETQAQALEGLNNLALKVDENLSRLKDESVYVDEVGRRLSDIRNKFEIFSEKDEQRFSEFREQMLQAIQQDIENIQSNVKATDDKVMQYQKNLTIINEKQEQEIEIRLQQFKSELEQVEGDFYTRLDKVSHQGEQLEHDAFQTLNENIEAHALRLQENWKGGLNELKEDVTSTASEITEQLSKTKSDMEQLDSQYMIFKERIQLSAGDLEKDLGTLGERLVASTSDLNNKIIDLDEKLELNINDIAERVEHGHLKAMQKVEEGEQQLVDNMNDLNHQQKIMTDQLNSGYDSMKKQIETELQNFTARTQNLDASIGEFVKNGEHAILIKVKQNQEEYRQLVENEIRKSTIDFEDNMNRLQDQMNTASHELEGGLESLDERLNSKSDELDTLLGGLAQHLQDETSQIKEVTEGLRSRIQAFVESSESKLLDEVHLRQQEYRQMMEDQIQNSQVDFESSLDELKDRLQKSDMELNDQIGVIGERLQGDTLNLGKIADDLEFRIQNFLNTTQSTLEVFVHEQDQEFRQVIEEKMQDTKNEFQRHLQTATSELEGNFNGLDERLKTETESLNERADELQSKVLQFMETNETRFIQLLTSKEDEYRGIIDEKLKFAEENFNNNISTLDNRLHDTASTLDSSMEQLEQRFGQQFSKLDNDLDELRLRADKFFEKTESDFLEDIEVRQNDYRKSIENRFEKLSSFIGDMDTLAENLRMSQKQTLTDVEEGFKRFDSDMNKVRDLEKESFNQDIQQLRSVMEDLGNGLEVLKAKAYDNMSEKIQMFEDDLFADLKGREDNLKAAMEKWREDVDSHMAQIGSQSTREREETERRFTAQFKQGLTELRANMLSQFDSFQLQVNNFKESLNGRMQASQDEIESFTRDVSGQIANEKKLALEDFQNAFSAFGDETDEKFKKANRILATKLNEFSNDIDLRSSQLREHCDQISDEMSSLASRVNSQISDVETNSKAIMDSIQADINSKITDLEDEYTSRTEELLIQYDEQRNVIRSELGEMHESISDLSSSLNVTKRETLETMEAEAGAFLLEFRKNVHDTRDEIDRKLKALRNALNEARENTENYRKEMTASIEQEVYRLSISFEELDRKQKQFIAETRIFDRADEMKESLEAEITELGRLLETVKLGHEELGQINKEYERSVDLYDNVQDKIAKFLAEQQKVEKLEGKISRIGTLSEDVEGKLDRVNDANDTLIDLQMKIKHLEDLHADLGKRYERLSDRSSILDTATENIDRNFQRMIEMESSVKQLSEQLYPIKEELNEVEHRQNEYDKGSVKVDTAIQKISTINDTIEELDQKLEGLGKVREWLARSETRLEEINKEIQQNLKVHAGHTSNEVTSNRGAPNLDTREVVVRLAKRGWKSDEIARSAKISQGEVELILEVESMSHLPKE